MSVLWHALTLGGAGATQPEEPEEVIARPYLPARQEPAQYEYRAGGGPNPGSGGPAPGHRALPCSLGRPIQVR